MKRLTWRGVPFFPVASLTLALSAGLAQADDASDLFSSLDKNSDGKLEKSEVPEEQLRHFERMLRSGDKDKDGILTKDEFSSAATAEEKPVTPPGEGRPGGPGGAGRPGGPGGAGRPNPEEMFRRLDKDGNGRLSREEVRSSEAPEGIKGFLGRMFDELKQDEVSPDDVRKAREQMGLEGGPGGAGAAGGRMMLDRLRQLDKNKDGKVSREELKDVPAEGRERLTQMMERTGRDEIDIARMEEMMAQGGPGGRPFGDGPRPIMREGGRPAAEGDRPRDGQRPEGAPRDGERRPEGAPRDGERRPEGAPRDGDRRPEGPRDGERRPEAGPRDGERRPEGAPRDGERRPAGGPRDGEGRPPFRPQLMRALDANDDGRISKEELQNAAAQFDRLDRNQDGHIDMSEAFGPPPGGPGRGMGPQDNPRRPEGDRPRPEGERPRGEGDRPRPEGDRPRGEGDRPRPEADRPRPEGERPRGEGDRPRPEGERPRGEGDRPRPEGDRPRGEGDRPRPEGERPRPEGDRPRPDGERPRAEGDRPRPEGERPRGEGDRPRPEGEQPPRGE